MRPFYHPPNRNPNNRRPHHQQQQQHAAQQPLNPNIYQSSARPNFNAQNPNFPSNFNIQNVPNAMGSFAPNQMMVGAPPFVPGGPSFPTMMQNSQMGGFPQMGQLGINPAAAAQNLNQILALQQLLGQTQSMNVLASLPLGGHSLWNNGMPQNFNQLGGVPNLPVNFQNPMMQGSQLNATNVPTMGGAAMGAGNLGVVAHPQIGGGSSSAALNNARPPMKHKQNGYQGSQFFQGKGGGSNNSNFTPKNSTRKGFRGGSHVFGKKDQPRFQRSLSQHAKVMKRNGGQFSKFSKNGQKSFPGWKNRSMKFNEPFLPEKPRFIFKYSNAEIRQWIEARKKNFPSRANIEKKLARNGASCEDADSDAKLRRQQLKEVLNKQAELGVEVAELPPGYLSDSENPACRRQGGYQGSNKTHLRNQDKTRASTSRVRGPTLLQKLLAADIRRDKHKVLQVFRFMVLNSFFVNWPDKHLEFPTVTIKDYEPEDEIEAENIKGGLEAAGNNAEKTALLDENQDPKDSGVPGELDFSSEDDTEGETDSSNEDDTNEEMNFSSEDDVKDGHGSITKCGKPEEGEITD